MCGFLMVDGIWLLSVQGGTEQVLCEYGGAWWVFCECVRRMVGAL